MRLKSLNLLLPIIMLCGCALSSKIPENKSLKILFLGDIMAHQAQLDAAQKSEHRYDFSSIFQKIAPTFQKYDLVIANFETTLAGKPYSGYPRFCSPVALALACRKAGIDLFLLSNNHILDRQEKGMLQTAGKLEALGIPYIGVRKSLGEQKYYLCEKNGIRIGVLNYTQFTNGSSYSPLVSYAKRKEIAKDIAKLKKENPDKIVICIHWGKEYRDTPDSYQQKMGQFLLAQGADIVIGSHPHTIQPYIWEEEKDNLLAYSLGNFVSNQRAFPRDGGLMLGVELAQNNLGKVKISQVEPIPIWVEKYFVQKKAYYNILPAQEYAQNPQYFRYEASYEKMNKFLEHCHQILGTNF